MLKKIIIVVSILILLILLYISILWISSLNSIVDKEGMIYQEYNVNIESKGENNVKHNRIGS